MNLDYHYHWQGGGIGGKTTLNPFSGENTTLKILWGEKSLHITMQTVYQLARPKNPREKNKRAIGNKENSNQKLKRCLVCNL